MEKVTLYKMKLQAGEEGLVVRTLKWISIHETPCFHYCVPERMESLVKNALRHTSETPLQAARRLKHLKRIHKVGSRFAFPTKEKALGHLRMLKRRQLLHMARETRFIEEFLACEHLEDTRWSDCQIVPVSESLAREYLSFD